MKFYKITSDNIRDTSGSKYLTESSGLIVSSTTSITPFSGTRYYIFTQDLENGQIVKGHIYEATYSGGNITFTDITPSEGGTNITDIDLVRPISDLSLYPYLQISTDRTFTTNVVVIDPRTDSEDVDLIEVFTGIEWIDFSDVVDEQGHQSGLGTPFDGMNVNINISALSFINEPFYIKYCWVTSDGVYGNYKSIKFPSLMIYGGNYGSLT